MSYVAWDMSLGNVPTLGPFALSFSCSLSLTSSHDVYFLLFSFVILYLILAVSLFLSFPCLLILFYELSLS